MGRGWIHLDELKFPNKCPKCGSRRFIVEGARKVEFVRVYEVTDRGMKLVDSKDEGVEWEVAYSVACAECGEDLSEEAGF